VYRFGSVSLPAAPFKGYNCQLFLNKILDGDICTNAVNPADWRNTSQA